MIVMLLAVLAQGAPDPASAAVEHFVAAVQTGQVEQSKKALADGKIREVQPVYKVARGTTFPGNQSKIEDLLSYVKSCATYTIKGSSFSASEPMRDFNVRWVCGGEKRYAAIVASRDGRIVKVFWGALGFAAPPRGDTFLPAVLKSEEARSNG